MRITAGAYKGRKLEHPKGIRPTQEKVRKAVFDILGDVSGLSLLELYAGSGAVGFEAASRGVKELVLVEYNRECLAAIRKNIESLKARFCDFYPREADEAVRALEKAGRRFDIVFMDPPYYGGLAKKTLQNLGACDILAPNGWVVVQHFKKDELPEAEGDLILCKRSKYGDTLLSFYSKKA